MVFSGLTFLFRFFPVFLLLYYIVPYKYKNLILLMGSIIFYAYGEPKYLFLLLASVLVNYILTIVMDKAGDELRKRKGILLLALLYNFGFLLFFKYINFAIDNINLILAGTGIGKIDFFVPVLPLGISFYTFQIVSYVVDVYRREIKAEKSIFKLALYLSMFPQLISGPITKYSSISLQLKYRRLSLGDFEGGLRLFTMGMGLKVLLADRIALLWNDIQTIGFESISTPLAWLGAYGYALQLYFDFFGYSLMAIGVGKILGFTLPENFNHPYIAKSVAEFWRRWHISLGTWFKNYVYIPMGGNRSGKIKLIFNLLVVWLFTGLWHGANWNFVMWGVSLFLLISIEKVFLNKYLKKHSIVARVYLIVVMPLTWVLFAIPKLKEIVIYFGRMFAVTPGINVNTNDFFKYFGAFRWYIIIGVFLCMPFAWNWYKKHEKNLLCTLFLFIIFWYSIYQLSNGLNNPFMYFNF